MAPEPGASRSGGLTLLAVGVAVVAVAALIWWAASGPSEPPRKVVPELTTVKILPPPPPPPPPPPKEPPPPQAQKMVEAPKMQDPMKAAPQAPGPKPSANNAPPGPPDLGLAQGAGPGDFGPSGSGGGGGGGGGSIAGWYASVIGSALYEAVTKDGRLEHAKGEIRARIWIGADGVPTRVELVTKLGDPKLDQAFEDIVLHELRPSDPPPKELPQPVVIRLRAQPPTRS